MKKKLPALLLSLVFLSGCIKAKYGLEITSSGKTNLNYDIAFNYMIINMAEAAGQASPLEEIGEEAKREGFKVERYKDGELLGIKALKDNADLNSTPIFKKFLTGDTPLVMQRNIFYTDYNLDTSIDLSKIIPEISDEFGVQNALMSQMNLEFTVTVPQKAEQENSAYLENNGNTYVWLAKFGKATKVMIKGRIYNFLNIGIASALIIILIVFTLILSRRKK